MAKTFIKHDSGKLEWSLLPIDSVQGIIRVLMFGSRKYTAHNWCAGADWSRYYNACLRHLTAWWAGESKDKETGYSHLWHAGCCLVFLIAYEIRGIGKDDRPI
jgi:hypothetical protein